MVQGPGEEEADDSNLIQEDLSFTSPSQPMALLAKNDEGL